MMVIYEQAIIFHGNINLSKVNKLISSGDLNGQTEKLELEFAPTLKPLGTTTLLIVFRGLLWWRVKF